MKKTNIHNWMVWLFLVGLTLFLTTCGDNNPAGSDENPPEPINPNTVSLDIGVDGASVTSKDGLVTLDFPEGALAGTETITITPIEQDELGSEFDEVIDELGFGKAYELGPDGLSFEKPVTVIFQSDQVVTQQGDSVSVSLELMFTNEEGGVVALDSLRMSVDEETGETTVTGELNHFSKLIATNKMKNVSFFVFWVPDYLHVGRKTLIKANMGVEANVSPGGPTSQPLKKALYKDLSLPPLQRTFEPAEQEIQDIEGGYVYGSSNSEDFEYSCKTYGLGIYKSEGSGYILEVSDEILFYNVQVTGLIVQKNVRCVAPPQLISPANGATDVELDIFLEWSDEGADSYLIQVAEEGQEFSDPNSIEIITDGPTIRVSELKPGTTYLWRVRAIFDDMPDDIETDWSEVWSFTTKAFHLVNPLICVENIDGDRFLILRMGVQNLGVYNYEDITVTVKVILPDGTESFVTYPLYSPEWVFLGHIIYSNGEHKYEVVNVHYKGEPINFTGEDLIGSFNVTDEYTNSGKCTDI